MNSLADSLEEGVRSSRTSAGGRPLVHLDAADVNLAQFLREAERQFLAHHLERARGNKSRAAEAAGVAYNTFLRKVAAAGLELSVQVL